MKNKRDNKNIKEFHHRVTRSYAELHGGRKKLRIKNSVYLQAVRRTAALRGLFFLLCFLFSLAVTLYAQEAAAGADEAAEKIQDGGEPPADTNDETAEEDQLPEQEKKRIELEIRSSTIPELAAWCRTLGLSEGGTREELAKRIREHFKLPENAAVKREKIITIESAQTTEYFKIEVTNEDYARLKGDVHISLLDNDETHNIMADEIVFNRTRNIITARGNVEYVKMKGDTKDTFRGQTITVNIDNWSSVFLDGNTEKKLEGDTTYRFTGSVISRNDEDVTVLRNAEISNANNEEALWSISASKLWLLPGSDFAIFNAWLKVGVIPVLYIPFFYFPADEVVFHPVVGFRSREGAFVQTTTYILGRPKANQEESNSLSKIMGNSNDMEKEPNGIFLRSTGKKIVNPDSTTLKVLIDYYTNLGLYTGLDFSMPRKGMLNPLELSMGVALTRTISEIGGRFTPFAPNYDGTFDWNQSNFFSTPVPFRYRLETNSSINGKYGSIIWDIDYLSDSRARKEFTENRSENMDWVNMVQQGAAGLEADEPTLASDIEGFKWTVNGNFNPQLKILSPYVSNVSLNTISTSLDFKAKNDKVITDIQHPGHSFFVPDKYMIYNIKGSITGTPLTTGAAVKTGADTQKSAEQEAYDPLNDPLKGAGTPRSPWTLLTEDEIEKKSSDEILTPPALSQRFELPKVGNARFSVNYSLNPESSSELQFRSSDKGPWTSFEKVDWSDVQSVLTSFITSGSVSFTMNHSDNLYTNSVSFNGDVKFWDYTYLNDEAEAYRTGQDLNGAKDPTLVTNERKRQYGNTNYITSYAYSGALRPFYKDPIFSQTSLEYNFRGTLVKSKKYSDGDGPELTPQWGSWVKEDLSKDILGLSSNRLTANLAANVLEKQQRISISADLPPMDGFVSTNGTFNVWISETTASISFRKPEIFDNKPNDEWKIDPFNLTETLNFGKIGSLRYTMSFKPEDNNEITSITSSLRLWNSFSADFRMNREGKYVFIPDNPADYSMGGKWEQQKDNIDLFPTELSFSYNPTIASRELIRNKLSFSMNVRTALSYNLQSHTNSNLQFSMGFDFLVNNFMRLTLSASSRNSVIFRYFKDVPGMEDLTAMYSEGEQNNVFIDLFDSFNFADDSKRRRSGFKMGNFVFKMEHFLGDWVATLDITMSPYHNQSVSPQRYELATDVSFYVRWSAISEIKSDVRYDKRKDKWTVSNM